MKKICCLFAVCLLMSGCVALHRQAGEQGQAILPTVVFHSTPGASILSCLQETTSLRSREFNDYFQQTEAQLKNGRDENALRLICLSLHNKASYRQFKRGEEVLRTYIEGHPDNRKELQGLMALVGRLDQAKVARWSNRKKLLDEKEELEAEVASLQARVDTLLREHEQDMVKIQELRNQIEQLKNIENIIKNREHGS